ncbi:MAG: AIPR family protein [Pseudomonadota bacterium]|jgi:hypothetical protein
MTNELKTFHHELFQEVQLDADAAGQYSEDAFFDIFCGHLVDEGELDTADRAHYQNSQRGIRIDGYGGDPTTTEGVLSLIISDFEKSSKLETLTATEMEATFKRGLKFLTKALDPAFRRQLEETSAGFGLADLIHATWDSVKKVKLILISNRLLSTRVDGRKSGDVEGRPLVYTVWDLGRLHRYVASGRAREDVVVDLAEHGGHIPALPAHLNDAGYESYLLVVPGRQLASIYDQWGPRLLEQNVRVFLQARGGVNMGIRRTIEQDPEMFFAYNNGVTATAERVEGKVFNGRYTITSIQNLQIVNGGQTTASIYSASQKKGVSLDKVFVQMKLSVIPPERAEKVVPKISEYANSQNKVSAADFFSNHPFHLRMKEFSITIFAPSTDGTFRESKWFYERARGQYADARSGKSVAELRRFDLEYPKTQLFTKTDLAKFANVWDELPHLVSKGAQKNFGAFAATVGKAWEVSPDQFNEAYFRHSVAKGIVFRETERLVSEQPWYEGGYRANIVAYAVAKLAHDVRVRGDAVNLEGIWKAQALTASMKAALTLAAEEVTAALLNPAAGMKNVTEWAKQQACWNRVAALEIDWPDAWLGELISAEQQRGEARSARRDQKVLNGIEAQMAVVNAGGPAWKAVRSWAMDQRILGERDLGILAAVSDPTRSLPTERQCIAAMKILSKLRDQGCPYGSEIA